QHVCLPPGQFDMGDRFGEDGPDRLVRDGETAGLRETPGDTLGQSGEGAAVAEGLGERAGPLPAADRGVLLVEIEVGARLDEQRLDMCAREAALRPRNTLELL